MGATATRFVFRRASGRPVFWAPDKHRRCCILSDANVECQGLPNPPSHTTQTSSARAIEMWAGRLNYALESLLHYTLNYLFWITALEAVIRMSRLDCNTRMQCRWGANYGQCCPEASMSRPASQRRHRPMSVDGQVSLCGSTSHMSVMRQVARSSKPCSVGTARRCASQPETRGPPLIAPPAQTVRTCSNPCLR